MDVQALGGLYDPITLDVFPDAMRAQIVAALAPVTPQSACQVLGVADHVRADRGLSANVLDVARRVARAGTPAHLWRAAIPDATG